MDVDIMETELDRYWPAIAFLHSGLFLIGLQFTGIILSDGSPMIPELYGPAIHSIDAIYWSTFQVFTSFCVVYGAVLRGKIGASIMILGGSFGFLMHSTFAVLAQKASQGIIVQGASTFVTTPASLLVVLIGIRYLLYVRR
jgi:hypothetical protein